MSRYFTPQTDTVELDGMTFTVHELNAGTMANLDSAEAADRAFVLLGAVVEGPDGLRLGEEEARALPPKAFNPLLSAALALNGMKARADQTEDEAPAEGNGEKAA